MINFARVARYTWYPLRKQLERREVDPVKKSGGSGKGSNVTPTENDLEIEGGIAISKTLETELNCI